MTATPGQAAPVMPDSAVLRAAILATEDSAPGAAPDWTDRVRLDGIIASWIGRELPAGTPSSVAASAAQRVTAGLAPFVEAEALRLAQAAVAAQEPHAAPEVERDALEDIARAGQGSIDTSIPLDRDWLVTRALEGLGWLPEGWPKAAQPAPELAATVLAEVLDFLGNGIPPGDEFAHQVAQWRKRGLPS